MKKVAVASILFTTLSGIYLARVIDAYRLFPTLETGLYVRWQDRHHPCGEPKEISDGDYVVIDNPLCEYSADLIEIPTVSHQRLAQNPGAYDGKIVRVKGRSQQP
jgi:hypothetical protein